MTAITGGQGRPPLLETIKRFRAIQSKLSRRLQTVQRNRLLQIQAGNHAAYRDLCSFLLCLCILSSSFYVRTKAGGRLCPTRKHGY